MSCKFKKESDRKNFGQNVLLIVKMISTKYQSRIRKYELRIKVVGVMAALDLRRVLFPSRRFRTERGISQTAELSYCCIIKPMTKEGILHSQLRRTNHKIEIVFPAYRILPAAYRSFPAPLPKRRDLKGEALAQITKLLNKISEVQIYAFAYLHIHTFAHSHICTLVHWYIGTSSSAPSASSPAQYTIHQRCH